MAELPSKNNQYTITDRAHVAITEYVKERETYLAWGDIPPSLTAPVIGTKDPVSGGSLTPGNYRYRVTAFVDFGETNGSSVASVDLVSGQGTVTLGWSAVTGADGYRVYRLNTATGNYEFLTQVTVTNYQDAGTVNLDPARVAPSTNGTVINPWTTSPIAPSETLNKLYREVGRRRANIKKFVKRDPEGEIETVITNSQGELELIKWSESLTPTNNLYFQVGFALTDASDKTIYQFGVFTDTVPAVGNENKNYLTPDQIQDVGKLLAVANVAPVYRDSTSREIREVIITF